LIFHTLSEEQILIFIISWVLYFIFGHLVIFIDLPSGSFLSLSGLIWFSFWRFNDWFLLSNGLDSCSLLNLSLTVCVGDLAISGHFSF
jgi:hypothetical protein